MPKKMRRLALKSALAAKAQDQEIRVVDEFNLESPRTREIKTVLGNLKCQPSALILLPAGEETVARAARNLEGVKTLRANYLNVRDLLGHDFIVMSQSALRAVENYFDGEAENAGQGERGE
jgi:large subunit ribosomal protein L4